MMVFAFSAMSQGAFGCIVYTRPFQWERQRADNHVGYGPSVLKQQFECEG